MPVAEQDIERIGVFRRVASEEPPEGYEPILHIRIPVDVDISDLKERGIVRIRYNGKPEIIDKNTKIDVDDKTMQFLSKPFTPQEKNWAYLRFDGAQLDCSTRMLTTFRKELLEKMLTELGFDRKLSKLDALRRKKAKLYLIKLIELHDGYFHLETLIDPRTKTFETVLISADISYSLPLSIYWHELWAIVNEMKFLDGVKDEISEFVKRKVEDVRRKTSSGGGVSYSMIYEIIRFFQSKGLTLNDMIKILEVPIKAFVYPELWLWCVLLDLAEGRDPTEIPKGSSYYKDGKEYDDRAELMKYRRKKILRNPITRMDESLYEVVVIGEDAIERRWFCLKPKPDIAEAELKSQIFVQKILEKHANLIPTTVHPTNFLWLEYQKKGLSIEDLFRDVMKRKISHEKLEQLLRIYHAPTTEKFVFKEAVIKTLVRMGFSDRDDYAKWLGFKNWDDFERRIESVKKIKDDF